MSERQAPTPPGRAGLPLLGETLALLRDPFGFIESRARRFGPVFRTRLLGRPTAVITGPDATAKFIDESDVQRAGAMPHNIETLFGGRTLPVLDGAEHHARKQIIMAAFTHEALESYVPTLTAIVRAALARWAARDEIRAVDELQRMAIEAIAATVLGLEPGPAIDGLRADYGQVLRGFRGLPVPLPGTAYTTGKRAVGRALHRFADELRRRPLPVEPAVDGLSRIVAARALAGASALDDDAVARELHHLVLAGLIVWAWCARALLELDRQPAVRARLLWELAALPADGCTLRELDALPYLDRVANEVRRATPVVPLFFGKARRSFTFAGHTVPAGWMVLWGAAASLVRPEVFPAPEQFDPDRFAPERAEHTKHPHAFAPNGAGDAVNGHKCAGYLFAPMLLKIFSVELLRGWSWQVPADQDMTYDWADSPPAPRDRLRVRLERRLATA